MESIVIHTKDICTAFNKYFVITIKLKDVPAAPTSYIDWSHGIYK